ncbi:MAG: sugar phosphate nucleotidyltransferase [Patescibacteria group bacterium]
MSLRAVILAGGLGNRMKSDIPKVLHPICGRPIIEYIIKATTLATSAKPWIVYSPVSKILKTTFSEVADFALQDEPRGTGHAFRSALDVMPADVDEIILTVGDAPLIRAETLTALIKKHHENSAPITMTALELKDPTGYGRLITDKDGSVLKIVEEKDATAEEKSVIKVNAGLYAFDANWARQAVKQLIPSPVTNEYYVTDLVAIARNQGKTVNLFELQDPTDLHGINTPEQLARAEEIMRKQTAP